MALFRFVLMSSVLRGLTFSTYDQYASSQTPARHRERSGEAGGLVRFAELLNFHKNRCEIPPQGGAHRKNYSFPNWKPIRALLISRWALIIITIKAGQSFLLIADALYLFKVI